MNEKVLIYLESYDIFRNRIESREATSGGDRLADVLPQVTTANEYSFDHPSFLSHCRCMEARIGRRPEATCLEVLRPLLHQPSTPFVCILDVAYLERSIIDVITAHRRWAPLAVFVLHCTRDEYQRCIDDAPEEWKFRLSRFFCLPKDQDSLFPPKLRVFLDDVTATAIEKARKATVFSAFISYSHQDQQFARWLYTELSTRGIRCWLDEKQLRAGDRIHSRIETAINERDKLLLCASKPALTSWWVENELNSVICKEQAFWKSAGGEALALVPLNLDGFMYTDSWKSVWKNQVVSRIAPDFSNWSSGGPSACSAALSDVVRALIIDTTAVGNPFSEG